MIVLRKSTLRPLASVSLPSSKIWRRMLNDFGVGLLDLVEQDHGVRLASHRFGELAAFLVADVSGRRTDETSDGVPLHEFRHVDLDQRSSLPNMNSARALASSVFPTPVGPRKIKLPIGRFGSLSPVARGGPRSISSRLPRPGQPHDCGSRTPSRAGEPTPPGRFSSPECRSTLLRPAATSSSPTSRSSAFCWVCQPCSSSRSTPVAGLPGSRS